MSKYNNYSALPFYGFQDGEEKAWDSKRWYNFGQIYPLQVPRSLIPFFFKKGEDSLIDAKIYKLCERSGTEISLSDFKEILPPIQRRHCVVTALPGATVLNQYAGNYDFVGEELVWENDPNIRWAKREYKGGEYKVYTLFNYSSGTPVSITGDENVVLWFRQGDFPDKPGASWGIGKIQLSPLADLGEEGNIRVSSGSWLDTFRANGLTEEGDTVKFMPGVGFFDDGFYYVKFISSNGSEYYSEIFKVESNMGAETLSVEWRNYPGNSNDMDLIPYSKGYTNRIYVESSLGMPSYEMEEEGEKRMGYFYPTKQISYKKYKFTFIAPEYLCDVIRLIPLSDSIAITDNDGVELKPTDFNIDFIWLEGGHYAQVDCEFTTDTVVKKIGGMQLYRGRDFNLDWNKDFNSLTLDK